MVGRCEAAAALSIQLPFHLSQSIPHYVSGLRLTSASIEKSQDPTNTSDSLSSVRASLFCHHLFIHPSVRGIEREERGIPRESNRKSELSKDIWTSESMPIITSKSKQNTAKRPSLSPFPLMVSKWKWMGAISS